jgi:hypothetical protein
MSNFTKIRPVGAELFHVGERRDKTKLTVAFHNFVNSPKNEGDGLTSTLLVTNTNHP